MYSRDTGRGNSREGGGAAGTVPWTRGRAGAWARSRSRRGRLSASGITRRLGNTAHVLVADYANVSLISPLATPRVLHFVVVLTTVGAVTHDKYTMVQCSATPGVIKHNTFVHLKCGLIGFDGDGYWADRGGSNQGFLVHFWDVLVPGNGDGALASLFVASHVGSFVRVRGFSAQSTIFNDKPKGIVHQAALAAVIPAGTVAIDEFLFRQ